VLCAWLALVIFTTAHHEYWRDEVRAFSLARQAATPFDLYGLLQNEGHPIVWYLLLFIGKSIVNTPLVLPIISIFVALSAVCFFMFFAPLPFWFRCLFLTTFPLFEYSVMARNYGIGMLFLFVCAALYRHREKRPWAFALSLALLANTHALCAILAILIVGLWFYEEIRTQSPHPLRTRLARMAGPFALVAAGVLLCALFVIPNGSTVATSVYQMGPGDIFRAFIDALFQPWNTFHYLMLFPSPWFVSTLLLMAILGLLSKPSLMVAAFIGEIAFGVFFRVVYPGFYRQEGLYFIFLLFLYWIYFDSPPNALPTRVGRWITRFGFYGAMGILLLFNSVRGTAAVVEDIQQARSSSKAFGEFLATSVMYHDAIILPEPSAFMESLPMYASNTIYLPRQHRFGNVVSNTTQSDHRLTLGELLALAEILHVQYNKPILIVIGFEDFSRLSSDSIQYVFNNEFTWTDAEYTAFQKSTTWVANYHAQAGDENYSVYAYP
jgi:hypothetical protein